MELKANILRIERLSLSDGKGMRTVVFFKGCPLRCAWCSTPESQSGQREVYYMKERCTGCGACIQVCPEQALRRSEKTGEIVRAVNSAFSVWMPAITGHSRSMAGR